MNKFKNIINSKTSVVEFLILLIYTFIITLIIYIFQFIIFKEYSDFVLCNEIINVSTQIFNNLTLPLPISCDFNDYVVGIQNPLDITTQKHPYQFRIIYFVFLSLINKIVNLFIAKSIFNTFITIVIGQVLILLLIASISNKLFDFNFKNSLSSKLLITTLLLFNPLFKFGLFDPSHQTLSFMSFILSFYFLKNHKILLNQNMYLLSFGLGVLYLANKVFAINFFILLIISFLNKKIDVVDFIFKYFSRLIIVFLVPNYLYTFYFKLNNLKIYDSVTETWGHFIWIKYYLFGDRVHFGEWYCHNIPDNFICYFQDSLLAIQYISIPLIGAFLFLYPKIKQLNLIKFNLDKVNFTNSLFLVSIIYYVFWGLIGWYPPLRFNLYTFLPLIFIIFLKLISNLKKYRYALFLIYLFYFSQVKHWNNEEIFDINLFFTVSIFLLILLIYKKTFLPIVSKNKI